MVTNCDNCKKWSNKFHKCVDSLITEDWTLTQNRATCVSSHTVCKTKPQSLILQSHIILIVIFDNKVRIKLPKNCLFFTKNNCTSLTKQFFHLLNSACGVFSGKVLYCDSSTCMIVYGFRVENCIAFFHCPDCFLHHYWPYKATWICMIHIT